MAERPLTPGQVADLFGVTVTTVGEWAENGKLPCFKTPGGQRRFRRSDVYALLPDPVVCECADPDPDAVGECASCHRLVPRAAS